MEQTHAHPLLLTDLRLEEALALLRHSGYETPEDAPGDVERMQHLIDSLCDLSQRDALTGLANVDHFRQVLDRELERVARMGDGTSLLLLGIDHMAQLTDMNGRAAAEAALRTVAAILPRSVRGMDFVARVGEEDFAVIVPGVATQHTRRIAERLRAVIARTPIALSEEMTVRVTVSVGGASAPPWRRMRAGTLIAAADRQLLAARSRRRDHIAIDSLPNTRVSIEERAMLFADPGEPQP